MEILTKICTKCNIEKPINEFPKWRNKCKECRNEERRNYKEILPEGYKKCTNPECNEVKLLSEFYKNNKNGYYQSRCKKCTIKEISTPKKPKENLPEGHRRCKKGKINCNEIKPISEFVKNRNQCKECKNKEQKQFRDSNPEKSKNYQRQYKENNPNIDKEYYKNNKKEINLKNKQYYENHKNDKIFKLKRKQYKNEHKEERNKRQRNKYKNDPLFKMICSMRGMLVRTLKFLGTKKQGRTVDNLGYSPLKLMQRLEFNFTSKMNWKNYGTYWEIDHKIPIDYFVNKGIYDPKIINALCNLQPLTIKENREKSKKLIYF